MVWFYVGIIFFTITLLLSITSSIRGIKTDNRGKAFYGFTFALLSVGYIIIITIIHTT